MEVAGCGGRVEGRVVEGSEEWRGHEGKGSRSGGGEELRGLRSERNSRRNQQEERQDVGYGMAPRLRGHA